MEKVAIVTVIRLNDACKLKKYQIITQSGRNSSFIIIKVNFPIR